MARGREMEVSLERMKVLDGARELITREGEILLEADYNLFIDRENLPGEGASAPWEDRLGAIKDRVLAHIPDDKAKVVDDMILDYLEMTSDASIHQIDAAFFTGWLFGSGQREAALKVAAAVPESVEASLHFFMDHNIEALDKQAAGLEVSSVVKLGVVPEDGEA